jgi:hypothetical protein
MAQADRKRAVDDAGAKIGGARKDYRREAMGVADLDAMTAAEQAALVKKDNVWAPPDYAALVAAGMDPQAAALVKIMRDGMAAKPTVVRGADPIQAGRDYVGMVGIVRDACLACRTVNDARGVYQAVADGIRWNEVMAAARTRDPAAMQAVSAVRNRMFSIFKRRSSPLQIGYDEIRRAARLVAEGFAAEVPAWRKGVRAVEFGGGVMLMKGKHRVGAAFKAEDEAWAWLRGSVEAARQAKAAAPPEPREPERPHLDHLERAGPDVRQGRDVTPDDFIVGFGFRGVEFGNWLPDGERQQVLNLAYESFHDLAALLGLPPAAIGLGGALAVAFGARGSGKFAAHYEPGRRVVNVTRLRGAGSTLHEWLHGLDHFLGTSGGAAAIENSDACYASGNRTHTKSRSKFLPNLSAEAGAAVDALLNAFRTSPKTREQAIADQEKAREEAREKVAKSKNYRARHLAAVAAGTQKEDRKWLGENAKFVAWWERALPGLEVRLARLREGGPDEKLGTIESDYLKEAKKLSGPSGEYWTRPTEMFARAGECAIFDLLADRGLRSDYLVHGVVEDRFAGPDYKGNPYPTGEERIRYKDLLLAVFDAVRPILVPEASLEESPSAGLRMM